MHTRQRFPFSLFPVPFSLNKMFHVKHSTKNRR